jgi:CheY-like chemotaxis protein
MVGGPQPSPGRSLKILLVEDNPDDAEITRLAAQRTLRCQVEVIADGAVARRELSRRARVQDLRPDVVLLDLRLPRVSGLDLLRHIRCEAAYGQTPVIVLTTVGDDDETILACYTSGANSFLQKPATDARFAEALSVLAMGTLPPQAPDDPAAPDDEPVPK